MSLILDEAKLHSLLKAVDLNIHKLNDQKIVAFLEFLGLKDREDIPKNYLDWETILIVVPNRHVSQQMKQYKFLISRIAFTTNPNAQQIHIYDFNEWKNATRNKTALQIRQLLKTNFGGFEKTNKDPDWVKQK